MLDHSHKFVVVKLLDYSEAELEESDNPFQDGEQKGRQEEVASILTRLLQRRFGELPAWVGEKIAQAESSTLEAWTLRILDASTIESVLADPS